jgi:hypothetical protein
VATILSNCCPQIFLETNKHTLYLSRTLTPLCNWHMSLIMHTWYVFRHADWCHTVGFAAGAAIDEEQPANPLGWGTISANYGIFQPRGTFRRRPGGQGSHRRARTGVTLRHRAARHTQGTSGEGGQDPVRGQPGGPLPGGRSHRAPGGSEPASFPGARGHSWVCQGFQIRRKPGGAYSQNGRG